MGERCKLPNGGLREKSPKTLFGVRYKRVVTLTTLTDSLKSSLQLLNQLSFAKLCLRFGLLVSSLKYPKMWWAWRVNRNFVFSLKTKILTEGKFWFPNFTKNGLKRSAKRRSRSVNYDSWIANSNPDLFWRFQKVPRKTW